MPSLKIAQAFLAPETRQAMSLAMASLILGAPSPVETVVELTNRVCDSVFQRSGKAATDLGLLVRRSSVQRP
jgi:hypothetical protein